MNWANPYYLYLLWFVPIVIFILFYRKKRNDKIRSSIADPHLEKVIWKQDDKRVQWRYIFLLFSFVFLILASARPRWGREISITEARGYNIVFALDASSSMLAEDVQPNRLKRAKRSIRGALNELSGSRVGLVAFSGKAYLLCPLTLDKNTFGLFIDLIEPDIIPSEGTNIGEAIRKSSELFSDKMSGSCIIIIVSDGENTAGDPRVEALEVREKGIKVFTISAGTKEGAPIPSFDSTGKFVEYRKDKNGKTHISIVNDDLLKMIANAGDGAFLQGEGVELGLLVGLFKGLRKGEFGAERVSHLKEKFIFFLMGSLIFLLAGIFIRTGRE